MLIKEEKKEKLIKILNQNYRTILSYGNKGVIPVGEFIVTDMELDKTLSKNDIIVKTANVILTKVDDENVKIVLPMITFLKKYSELSEINADKLSIGSDLLKTVQDAKKNAESRVLSDETLKELINAETITLEESDAEYLINGEIQSSNYSLCPVNLGKYRERIKEKLPDRAKDGNERSR